MRRPFLLKVTKHFNECSVEKNMLQNRLPGTVLCPSKFHVYDTLLEAYFKAGAWNGSYFVYCSAFSLLGEFLCINCVSTQMHLIINLQVSLIIVSSSRVLFEGH